MRSIFDIATELLKSFVSPAEELAQTEGLTEKNLRAFLEHKGVSDFLMYRSYYEKDEHEGMGIYEQADGRKGVILRLFPSAVSSETIEDSIFGVVDTIKYKGAIVHVNTFASRNINHLLEDYKHLHHCNVKVDNADMLKEFVRDQYDYMKEGVNESLHKNVDFRIRDFVCTISILFPQEVTEEEICTTYNRVKGNLRKLHPLNFKGSSLVRLGKEFMNPESPMKDWEVGYDKNRWMNNQISSAGTNFKTKKNSGDIIVDEKWKYRTFTTKQFPDESNIVSNYDLRNLFFDPFGEDIQTPVPCPFMVSLVIVVGDDEKAREKAADKSRDDLKKVKKLDKEVLDARPELPARMKEAKRNIGLLEGGNQTPREAMWSFTIMEKDEAKLNEYTSSIKSRFAKRKAWQLEEEKFGNLSLFVFLYSFPLQHHKMVQKFLKRFDILFTSNLAAIAPLLGNISSSRMVVPFYTRDNSLAPYDSFAGDNYNSAKTGESGSGKSYSQAYIHLMQLTAGIKLRVIDNGRSYERLCKIFGGTYIDIGRDKNVSLNFFTKANTAKVIDSNGNETSEELLIEDESGQKVKKLHSDELQSIVSLIGLMVDIDFIGTKKDTVSAKDATDESFLEAIITKAVNDTFTQHQFEGKLQYTREILFNFFEKEKECGNEEEAALIYKVYVGLYDFADIRGSEYIKFNTPHNLPMEKDYVVLETLGLKGKILRIVTVSLALAVKSEFWKEGVKKRKILDIDEGWMFKDSKIVISIIEDNARTFRKSNSGQSFITQTVQDYAENSSMQALFSSCYNKIFLAQGAKEIKKVASGKFFPLDPYQTRLFTSIEKKKGYWSEMMLMNKISGDTALIVKTSPKIHWLCSGADPDGNIKYDSAKKEHNFTDMETIRFMCYKEEHPEVEDFLLAKKSKGFKNKISSELAESIEFWKKEIDYGFKNDLFKIALSPIRNTSNDEITDYKCRIFLEHEDTRTSTESQFSNYLSKLNLAEKLFEFKLKTLFEYMEIENVKVNISLTYNEIRNHKIMAILWQYVLRYDIHNMLQIEIEDNHGADNLEELIGFIEEANKNEIRVGYSGIDVDFQKITYLRYLNIDFIKFSEKFIKSAVVNEIDKSLMKLIVEFYTTKESEFDLKVLGVAPESFDINELKKDIKIDGIQRRQKLEQIKYIK